MLNDDLPSDTAIASAIAQEAERLENLASIIGKWARKTARTPGDFKENYMKVEELTIRSHQDLTEALKAFMGVPEKPRVIIPPKTSGKSPWEGDHE